MPTEILCCCAFCSAVPTQRLRTGAPASVFPSLVVSQLSLAQVAHACTDRLIETCSRIVKQVVDAPVSQIHEQIVIDQNANE